MDDNGSSDIDELDWQSSGFYSESKYEFLRQLSDEENQLLQLLEIIKEAKNKVELERLALISESTIPSGSVNTEEAILPETSNVLVHEQLSLHSNAGTQYGNPGSSITSSRCVDLAQREDDTSKLTNTSRTLSEPLPGDLFLQLPVRADSEVLDAPIVLEPSFPDKNAVNILKRMVNGHYYCEVSRDREESESSSDSEDMENVMDYL